MKPDQDVRWTGTVQRGKVRCDQQAAFTAHVRSLESQPIEVVVRRRRKRRSTDQNAWAWGVAYPLLAESLGYDAHEMEDLHYALVEKWGGTVYDRRIGAHVPKVRSSALTTALYSDYMEWLVRFGASYGVVIPLPDEQRERTA